MKKALLLTAGCALALSVPAAADEPFAVTPSGATEAYFDLGITDTSDMLANKCVDLGWTMVSSTDTTVVCEVPVSFGTKLLSALAGPRYATPPRQFFRFNLAGANGLTRAQASSWQEIQTAFGQNQRNDLASDNYHNNVMGFFKMVGGIFPPNTTFPNHAAMNTGYRFIEEPEKGMLLSEVEPDGPFGRAGLLEGDIVTKIAGERIKDNDDLSDGLHKAIEESTFEVELRRGGEKMRFAVPRTFNEDIGPLPEPTFVETVNANQTTIVQNELSVADELAKFADLRNAGIISDQEFDVQKARLLGLPDSTQVSEPEEAVSRSPAEEVKATSAMTCATCD